MRNLRKEIQERHQQRFVSIGKILEAKNAIDRFSKLDKGLKQMQMNAVAFGHSWQILSDAQTIIFSAEQAEVFSQLSEEYNDGLEYKLPFPMTFLQFDRPVSIDSPVQIKGEEGVLKDEVIGFALEQVDRDPNNESLEGTSMSRWIYGPPPGDQAVFLRRHTHNIAICIFADDYEIGRLNWVSESKEEFLDWKQKSLAVDAFRLFKNLAIACIGYINCDNVYLSKRGNVDESVNRKRRKKGKRELEPYYVCRIRGVQYDSDSTDTGVKHGHIYDVRGHFRRLSSGKVTWVRPHQRGLSSGGPYIPKVYKVDKGAKG